MREFDTNRFSRHLQEDIEIIDKYRRLASRVERGLKDSKAGEVDTGFAN
jgi:hypothetical protein